jgi:Ca-activated chloride channel family protein
MIEDGTAIGLGLANAINRMKESPTKSKVVILLTDGSNNRGDIDPITAAEIAKTYGVRVYTIGVGAEGTAPYPVMTPYGVDIQDVEVQIDEALLEDIALETDGKYFRATDNSKLLEIYGEINKMERSKTIVDSFPIYKELFMYFGLVALLSFAVEMLLRAFVVKQIPD